MGPRSESDPSSTPGKDPWDGSGGTSRDGTTSSLSAEEALLRWRVVFPSQTQIDPLRALARAMDRAAHGVLEGGSEGLPRLSRETQARIAVLSRFLEKLPRMSEARVEGLQVEFDAPTQ